MNTFNYNQQPERTQDPRETVERTVHDRRAHRVQGMINGQASALRQYPNLFRQPEAAPALQPTVENSEKLSQTSHEADVTHIDTIRSLVEEAHDDLQKAA